MTDKAGSFLAIVTILVIGVILTGNLRSLDPDIIQSDAQLTRARAAEIEAEVNVRNIAADREATLRIVTAYATVATTIIVTLILLGLAVVWSVSQVRFRRVDPRDGIMFVRDGEPAVLLPNRTTGTVARDGLVPDPALAQLDIARQVQESNNAALARLGRMFIAEQAIKVGRGDAAISDDGPDHPELAQIPVSIGGIDRLRLPMLDWGGGGPEEEAEGG